MDTISKLISNLCGMVMKILEGVIRAEIEILYNASITIFLVTTCFISGYFSLRFGSCSATKTCPTSRVVVANIFGVAALLLFAYVIYRTFIKKPPVNNNRRR